MESGLRTGRGVPRAGIIESEEALVKNKLTDESQKFKKEIREKAKL